MSDPIGWVVARIEASGEYEGLSSTVLHKEKSGAEWERDLVAGSRERSGKGERWAVCAVVPVSEGEQ